jgi:hypothetical protein
MSREDARSFLERVVRDRGLEQATRAVLQNESGTAFERLIELGAARGLSFTSAELSAAWQEWRDALATRELRDGQLERVAGGLAGLGSLSEMTTLERMRLQKYLDSYSKTMESLSDAIRQTGQTESDIIRTMK